MWIGKRKRKNNAMKRTSLPAKGTNQQLAQYHVQFSKKDHLELLETDEYKVIICNNQPVFFYYQSQSTSLPAILLPTLKFLQRQVLLKTISIDMGAVKFIINGADVMRPGITDINGSIDLDEFVTIVDQMNKKPLAIGRALYSGREMKMMTSGKVIKNIHYVGDPLWNLVA